jgi:septal ring factor EnvC (AmiA/AmiB activator)
MTQAVDKARKAAAAAVDEINAEIDGIEQQIANLRKQTKVLRRRREEWAKLAAPAVKVPSVDAARTSAGPAAVNAVADYLREHGPAYQSEIAKATKLNSGTITHALRVLAHDHAIAATGLKRRNSAQYEWTGAVENVSVAA